MTRVYCGFIKTSTLTLTNFGFVRDAQGCMHAGSIAYCSSTHLVNHRRHVIPESIVIQQPLSASNCCHGDLANACLARAYVAGTGTYGFVPQVLLGDSFDLLRVHLIDIPLNLFWRLSLAGGHHLPANLRH